MHLLDWPFEEDLVSTKRSALRAIYWDGDAVAILDQRVLPQREVWLRCTDAKQVIKAIRTMAIRGAPAIGIAAAMALALGARGIQAADPQTFRRNFCDCAVCSRKPAHGGKSGLGGGPYVCRGCR